MTLNDSLLEKLAACISKVQHIDVSNGIITTGDRAAQLQSSIEKCETSKCIFVAVDKILMAGLKCPSEGYWGIFMNFCHKDIIDEIISNETAKTLLDRGRLWLCFSLNANLLESYIVALDHDRKILEKYYVSKSNMRSCAFRSLLVTILSGLEHVDIVIDATFCLDLPAYDFDNKNLSSSGITFYGTPDIACDALELDDSLCVESTKEPSEITRLWRHVGPLQGQEEVPTELEAAFLPPNCLRAENSLKATNPQELSTQSSLHDIFDEVEVKLRKSKSGHLKRVSFHENSKRSSWSSDSNYYSMIKSSSGLSLSSCASGCVDKQFNPPINERWDPDGQEDPPAIRQSYSLVNLADIVAKRRSSQSEDVLTLSADRGLLNRLNRLFLSPVPNKLKTIEEINRLVKDIRRKYQGDIFQNKNLVPCPRAYQSYVTDDLNLQSICLSQSTSKDLKYLEWKTALQVLANSEESNFRIYPILSDHCEGQDDKLVLAVSSRQMYVVNPIVEPKVNAVQPFSSVLWSVFLHEIQHIEVGLEYQSVRFHLSTEDIVVTVGSRTITQSLVSYISFLRNNILQISFCNDLQYSRLLRCIGLSSESREDYIFYYGLVCWDTSFGSLPGSSAKAKVKQGELMYILNQDESTFRKWNPCSVLLKRGFFQLFDGVNLETPYLTFSVLPSSSHVAIIGCRKCFEFYRPHTFELTLSSSGSLVLAAANEEEVESWIQIITGSLASKGPGALPADSIPCAVVITKTEVKLIQHTNWDFQNCHAIASCELTNIAKLWYVDGVPVCRIIPAAKSKYILTDWCLYFVTEEQCALFTESLYDVYKIYYKKVLERQVMDPSIKDHVMERHKNFFYNLVHSHYF